MKHIIAILIIGIASAVAATPTPTPAPVVIPAPVVRTVTQVTPSQFVLPADKVPALIAALMTDIAATGATVPTIPAGVVITGLNARVLPNGTAQVVVMFSKP